jgi:hypothetical protein
MTITQQPLPYIIGVSSGNLTFTCHSTFPGGGNRISFFWSYQPSGEPLPCNENNAYTNTCTFIYVIAHVGQRVECFSSYDIAFYQSANCLPDIQCKMLEV